MGDHMRHRTRLAAIERKQAHRRPPAEYWIYTVGGEHDEMARSALTGALKPVVDLPESANRIVITYDRDMTP